jgi:hypothetical protein
MQQVTVLYLLLHCISKHKENMMKHVIILVLLIAVSYAGQIVANKDSSITSITAEEAKNIFELKKVQWANGSPITVYLLPAAHEAQEKFASTILGSNAAAVYDKWVAYILNGGANIPPKTINERKMGRLLGKTSGAIGILSDTATLPANVVLLMKF